MMVLFHSLSVSYGRPPSQWLVTSPHKSPTREHVFALDFDAACLTVGREAEAEALDAARNAGPLG